VPPPSPVLETSLAGLRLSRRGKVRDVYDAGPDELLIVASDRISAFDFVLATGIPDKGRILTQLSAFWFDRLRDVVPNHLISLRVEDWPEPARREASLLAGRTMLVKRADPLPIECVARGYLAGSAWQEYQASSAVCGIHLPPGLREAERLPHPIFTPATKASSGHDLNITAAEAARLVGAERLERLKALTLELYRQGAAHAESKGILVADTKFEFGTRHGTGGPDLWLIDEVLTPDSSRFWPADDYRPGRAQASFDKQFVRDHLESLRWNKQPPVPGLPAEVVRRTREKYLEALWRLTGQSLPEAPEPPR
jgi:phosphoribosylaminoimidazole-succinocarboxamide synthase